MALPDAELTWQKQFLNTWPVDAPVLSLEEATDTDGHMPLIFPGNDAKAIDGRWQVELIGIEYGRSLKENPQVVVEMEILSTPINERMSNFSKAANKTIKGYLIIRENGVRGWEQLLDACGFDDDPDDDFNIRTLIGSRLSVQITDGFVRSYHRW